MLGRCIRHRLIFSARSSPLRSVPLGPRARWSSSSSDQALPPFQVHETLSSDPANEDGSIDDLLGGSPENSSQTLDLLPPSSSIYHDSLDTYLEYARLNELDEESTVYKGTHYEYVTQNSLSRLGFNLTRTGKGGDRGIDLVGTWKLPSLPHPLRCIVQCKAVQKSRLNPSVVRELQGAFATAPAGWRGDNTVSVLVSMREATKGVRDAIRDSRRPVVWIMLDQDELVQQFLWNRNVADIGAEGMSAAVQYRPRKMKEQDPIKEVVLLWKGDVWDAEKEMNSGTG